MEDTFFRPVDSTTNVCAPEASPVALKTGVCVCSVGAYKSSSVTKAPSRYTRPMPAHGARKPTQLTAVPVKGNVAPAPADRLNDAVRPLQSRVRLPCHQPAGRSTAVVPVL